MNNPKIVLTGGHAAATAYAVIEKIKLIKPDWIIYWIGTKWAIEGKLDKTLEYKTFPGMGINFIDIKAGRIQRKFTKYTIPSLLKIPVGFIQSFYHLARLKPNVVLSFGGFAGFPVVVASWILRIPVVVHEQTAVAGRANRLSSFFANKIALSRASSLKYFDKNKSTITGNPLSSEFDKPPSIKNLHEPSVLLISGGSRGSELINDAFMDSLSTLLKNYLVIHQTGEGEYNKFLKVRETLTKDLKPNYRIFPFIEKAKWYKVLSNADLVVGRAGANFVSEIIALKKPSILIPLAISYLDEQTENAKIAERIGLATIVNQNELNGEILTKYVNRLRRNYSKIIKEAKVGTIDDLSASSKLVEILEKYVG